MTRPLYAISLALALRPRPPARRRESGSAALEFIVMVPFVLVMMGLIWDLREYTSHRTELAREMYVVAEVIANEAGPHSGVSPIEGVVGQAIEALGHRGAGNVRNGLRARSAGRISVAVIVRGDRRPGDSVGNPACRDEDIPCLPRLADIWPPKSPAAEAAKGTWNGGGDCARSEQVLSDPIQALPDVGDHFPQGQPVLPNEVPENGSPPPLEEIWPSRNLRLQEWWVLVDTCFHSDPGLFGGMALRGLEFFDVSDSSFVIRRRAAWGSVHDYSDCNWCPSL